MLRDTNKDSKRYILRGTTAAIQEFGTLRVKTTRVIIPLLRL
jgi:hypothetical protein